MNKREQQPHGEPWMRAQDEADEARDPRGERQEDTENLFGAMLPQEEPRRVKRKGRRAR